MRLIDLSFRSHDYNPANDHFTRDWVEIPPLRGSDDGCRINRISPSHSQVLA
jgi:hypothetical protein